MSLFVMLWALSLISSVNLVHGDTIYDVTKYGAKGDGRTDDTQAFMNVFRMACNGGYSSSPRLLIPSWGKFVVRPTNIQGPCKPNYMSIQLDGRIIPHEVNGQLRGGAQWLTFRGINNLSIWGKGGIDGDGPRLGVYKENEHAEMDDSIRTSSSVLDEVQYVDEIKTAGGNEDEDEDGGNAWPGERRPADNDPEKPTNVAFFGCNHLRIDGISSSYSEKNHMSISACQDVIISNLKIRSPSTSKNTDGIDISYSSWITIRDSNIQTGDDCIAINAGTSNVNISNVYCGPGHGISIGSFKRGAANVENVEVRHCTFTGSDNGARIKTFSDGIGGYVRRVTFIDIILQNVKRPIVINQFYVDLSNNNSVTTGAGKGQVKGFVDIGDVKFIGFRGTCSDDIAIFLNCRVGAGCNGITMRDVNIIGSRGQPVQAECHNAHGTAQSVSPRVDCLNGRVRDRVYKQLL